MKKFLILSIGRCRTLWFSFLFTTPESYCYHESFTPFNAGFIERGDMKYVGSTETTPIYVPKEELEQSTLLVIKRDPDEVKASFARVLGRDNKAFVRGVLNDFIDKNFKRLKEIIKIYNPKVVDYYSLSDVSAIERIWLHLLPSITPDEDKIKRFIEARIELVNYNFSTLIKRYSER